MFFLYVVPFHVFMYKRIQPLFSQYYDKGTGINGGRSLSVLNFGLFFQVEISLSILFHQHCHSSSFIICYDVIRYTSKYNGKYTLSLKKTTQKLKESTLSVARLLFPMILPYIHVTNSHSFVDKDRYWDSEKNPWRILLTLCTRSP